MFSSPVLIIKMTMEQIQGEDNDKVLCEMLGEEIKRAREKKSSREVLKDVIEWVVLK